MVLFTGLTLLKLVVLFLFCEDSFKELFSLSLFFVCTTSSPKVVHRKSDICVQLWCVKCKVLYFTLINM